MKVIYISYNGNGDFSTEILTPYYHKGYWFWSSDRETFTIYHILMKVLGKTRLKFSKELSEKSSMTLKNIQGRKVENADSIISNIDKWVSTWALRNVLYIAGDHGVVSDSPLRMIRRVNRAEK